MNCKICTDKHCDCLCDTCLKTKVIYNLPKYVYEMDEYTRNEWITRQVRALKGEHPHEK